MDAVVLDSEGAREAAVRDDCERLQGTWNFVSGIREAQLCIVGEHFTVQFTNGDHYYGIYALDPATQPKRMDMTIYLGPDKHRGKTSLIIYELHGDTLVWCPAEPGTGNRLSTFPSEEDLHHLCIVFRRDTERLLS